VIQFLPSGYIGGTDDVDTFSLYVVPAVAADVAADVAAAVSAVVAPVVAAEEEYIALLLLLLLLLACYISHNHTINDNYDLYITQDLMQRNTKCNTTNNGP
jgi:hypothetical protein